MAEQGVTFYIQQLEKYKAHLKTRRSSGGRHFAKKTIEDREKGAEDFALFLLGLECTTERIRGALKGERTKRLSTKRST